MVNKKWGSYRSQQTTKDFRVKDIRVKRELEFVPDYKPEYLPIPKIATLDINITSTEETILQSLIRVNQYGASEAEAIRACFMRWYNATSLKEFCALLLLR